jgi:membrane-associated protein
VAQASAAADLCAARSVTNVWISRQRPDSTISHPAKVAHYQRVSDSPNAAARFGNGSSILLSWIGEGACLCGKSQANRRAVIESIHHLLAAIYNVRGLIEWGGTLLVCMIVFVETGLFAGFFLPGDSLLVTAGIFAATGQVRIALLVSLVPLCAIAGDQLGYLIGWKAGEALYSRPDSRFFKQRHLEEAHAFYEKHGAKAIILARFIPIVRTFCPPVAGAARMRYRNYLSYDILGGLLWTLSTLLGGYFLARRFPNIDRYIQWVIAVVVLVSLTPPVIHLWQRRRAKNVVVLQGPEAEKQ